MIRICLVLICLVCMGCTREEAWREKLIGTVKVGNVSDAAADCSEAVFDPWEESPYNLPYAVGQGYIIGLGPCGGSYHSPGLPDMFAIDFIMDIGTRILAVRSGRVVYVEESGLDGGFPNNLVVVEHADGSHALYMHLTHRGAAVAVGQQVAQGALLGYSGNTGLAGYPHLHLVVTAPGPWQYPYQSLPVNFRNTQPNPKSLESGVMYVALPN